MRNIRPFACKACNSSTISLRNSILCLLVSDFQQRIKKMRKIKPAACIANKSASAVSVREITPTLHRSELSLHIVTHLVYVLSISTIIKMSPLVKELWPAQDFTTRGGN